MSASAASIGAMPPVPMTFGQIFDRSFRLLRVHLRLFLSIAAVPSAAIFAVFVPALAVMVPTALMHGHGQSEPSGIAVGVAGLLCFVGYLAFPAVFALYLPAASYAATQANRGVSVTFREAYAVSWRRIGRYLWLMLLGSLYVIVPLLVVALTIGAGALLLHFAAGVGSDSPLVLLLIPLGILLYVAVLIYSIFITLQLSLAYPACVVEDLPAAAALQRSRRLTKGSLGRIFLVLLLVYAITYLVSMICFAIVFVVGALVAAFAMLAHVAQDSPAFWVLIGLAGLGYLLILVATCLTSYASLTTALAVIYHDQRLRIDGPTPVPVADGVPA